MHTIVVRARRRVSHILSFLLSLDLIHGDLFTNRTNRAANDDDDTRIATGGCMQTEGPFLCNVGPKQT